MLGGGVVRDVAGFKCLILHLIYKQKDRYVVSDMPSHSYFMTTSLQHHISVHLVR